MSLSDLHAGNVSLGVEAGMGVGGGLTMLSLSAMSSSRWCALDRCFFDSDSMRTWSFCRVNSRVSRSSTSARRLACGTVNIIDTTYYEEWSHRFRIGTSLVLVFGLLQRAYEHAKDRTSLLAWLVDHVDSWPFLSL